MRESYDPTRLYNLRPVYPPLRDGDTVPCRHCGVMGGGAMLEDLAAEADTFYHRECAPMPPSNVARCNLRRYADGSNRLHGGGTDEEVAETIEEYQRFLENEDDPLIALTAVHLEEEIDWLRPEDRRVGLRPKLEAGR